MIYDDNGGMLPKFYEDVLHTQAFVVMLSNALLMQYHYY